LGADYSVSVIIAGFIFSVFARCYNRRLKRIAKVSEVVVPFMAVTYFVVCLIILICNIQKIPGAIAEIVASAFGLRAAAGGALGAIMIASRRAWREEYFRTNPASAVRLSPRQAAQTKEPARRALCL
jgi:AGCS family alanine or glycine:cation symporter